MHSPLDSPRLISTKAISEGKHHIMEKVRQVATLLILAMAATWVPTRLAQEVSPSPVTADSPFLPDYYSPYEPISDLTELEPAPGDDLAPFTSYDDDIEPAAGQYGKDEDAEEEEEENELEEALSKCWVALGEKCGEQVFNNFVNKRLAFTYDCCLGVRKVIEKPCWNTMFEEVGLLGSFANEIKAVCLGDLSKLPIGIHDQQ
ncbi:hypothetical protein ACLOJK_024945 [Asimina triloba]